MPPPDNWSSITSSTGSIGPLDAPQASSKHSHPKRRSNASSHGAAANSSTIVIAPSGHGSNGSNGPNGASDPAGTAKDTPAANAAANSKNVSHVPCKFFRQSMCQAGDKCPFSHEVDSDRQAVCKYFEKGNCKFGSKCALAHIGPDGKQRNKRPQRSVKDNANTNSGTVTIPGGTKSPRTKSNGGSMASPSKQAPINLVASVQSIAPLEGPESRDKLKTSSIATPNSSFGPPAAVVPAVRSHSAVYPPMLSSPVNTNSHLVTGLSPPSLQSSTPPNVSALNRQSRGSFPTSNGSRVGSIFDFSVGSTPAGARSSSMSILPNSSASVTSSIWSERMSGMGANPQLSGSLVFEGSAIIDDDDSNDDVLRENDEGFEEGLVPSALTDLLTPLERERRNSRNSRESNGSRGGSFSGAPGPTLLNGTTLGPSASIPLAANSTSSSINSPLSVMQQSHISPQNQHELSQLSHHQATPMSQLKSPLQPGQSMPSDLWAHYQRPPIHSAHGLYTPSTMNSNGGGTQSPIGYPKSTPDRNRGTRLSASSIMGSPPPFYGFGMNPSNTLIQAGSHAMGSSTLTPPSSVSGSEMSSGQYKMNFPPHETATATESI